MPFIKKSISQEEGREKLIAVQSILVLHDTSDHYAKQAFRNTCQSLKYARLDFESVDLSAEFSTPDLSKFTAVLCCTELLWKIGKMFAVNIKNFVTRGGGLVVLYRGWNVELAEIFGASNSVDEPEFLKEPAEGLCFPGDTFPGYRGLRLSAEEFSGHSPFDIWPKQDICVVATASSGRPLAWLSQYGEGRVLYWNSSALVLKRVRGLIIHSFASVQPVSVLPIANVVTIQIDDFPAPVPNSAISSNDASEATAEFYNEIWHPDMLIIADKYNLKYTYLTIFDYRQTVRPPFDFNQWSEATIQINGAQVSASTYAASVASLHGELGIHGYNHASLTLYKWPTLKNMVDALEATGERWQADCLGSLPLTYAPPNNEIDRIGTRALSIAIPSLETICSLYTYGDYESGANREFGPEPWNDCLFAMPRATHGYELTPDQKFDMLSLLGTMGVWTHFLHADDVFDTPQINTNSENHRNPCNLPWRSDSSGEKQNPGSFYDHFVTWIEYLRSEFPWLRFLTTTDALPVLRDHLDNEIEICFESNGLSLTSTHPSYFQVRINNGWRVNPVGLLNAELISIYHGDGFQLCTFRSIGTEVKLEFL